MSRIVSRRALVLTSLLTLSHAATAQLGATFVAKTKMTALAHYSTTGSKTAEIPSNTSLVGGKSIAVSNGALASVGVTFSNTKGPLRATISESGTGRYVTPNTGGYSKTGPHSTLLTLTSSRSMPATLRITWTLQTKGVRGAGAGGAVDIGDDGTFEFNTSAGMTRDFPVTIDGTGLKVATRTQGWATANSTSRFVSYNSSLILEILPPPTALFFDHGKPCGLTLSAQNGFFDEVKLHVIGGASRAPGLLVIGMQRTSLALPGTNCRLRVVPLVALPVRFTSTGSVTLSATLPPARPFVSTVQVGALQGTTTTSNGLTIFSQ